MLIIDNLGLVDVKDMKAIESDDYVSKEIVKIRDESAGIIIVVHHLNKSQLDKSNMESGYRPREEDVRGSSRILDYANNVILVNFIAKYKDLVKIEKDRIPNIDLNIDLDNFPDSVYNVFMKINPDPDNKHKDYNIESFNRSIRNLITYYLSERALLHINATKKYKDHLLEIIRKYMTVVLYQTEINNARSAQYRSKVMDIITYLDDGYYNKPSTINKDSKYWYLYGDQPDKYRKHLEMLFIIDGAKIREGETDDGSVLIRYKADPSINKFIEI